MKGSFTIPVTCSEASKEIKYLLFKYFHRLMMFWFPHRSDLSMWRKIWNLETFYSNSMYFLTLQQGNSSNINKYAHLTLVWNVHHNNSSRRLEDCLLTNIHILPNIFFPGTFCGDPPVFVRCASEKQISEMCGK